MGRREKRGRCIRAASAHSLAAHRSRLNANIRGTLLGGEVCPGVGWVTSAAH